MELIFRPKLKLGYIIIGQKNRVYNNSYKKDRYAQWRGKNEPDIV